MLAAVVVALSVLGLTFTTVRNGCHEVAMWQNVNIPIAPAVASTEVLRGTAIFDSTDFLGALLTLRNGKAYATAAVRAAAVGSDVPSAASIRLLRQLGIANRDAVSLGSVTPVGRRRAIPTSYTTVVCF
jgi:hypothetical protein